MTKHIRSITGAQANIYNDALIFINELRKPENADLMEIYMNFSGKPSEMYYEPEWREEWMRMFNEELPPDVMTPEQFKRWKRIERMADSSGHSGFSFAYMIAVVDVAIGKRRDGSYRNWLRDLERLQYGSCILDEAEAQIIHSDVANTIWNVEYPENFGIPAEGYDIEPKTEHVSWSNEGESSKFSD